MWLAVVLFFIFIALLLYLDTCKPRNFPPGPQWLPIVGSAIEIQKVRTTSGYFVKTLYDLGVRYCDRGVLGLKVGKDRIVITHDPDASRQLFLNDDMEGRPKGLFYETRTWGKRRGIVLTDGDLWRDHRRFIARHLKDFGLGRREMSDIIRAESEQLLLDMKKKCAVNNNNDAVVKMHDIFSVYVLNTLWTMMAGIRYSSEDAELKELQSILFELFSSIDMVGALFSHFPVLRYVAPSASGYTQFVNLHRRIWKFLKKELDKHEKLFKMENEDRDFMDVYLRKIRTSGTKNSFSEDQLLAVCMDLFMAGTETTNKSMGFAFLHLVREQKVQKRAQQEIDAVIGRERLPTLNDRAQLPYNEAIVLEVLRHFMSKTLGIPHRALRKTKLHGYTIPKDAMIVPNFYGIMMNEEIFEDAKAFKPERFLVDGKISIPDVYMPFGIGKHRCMGESLAKSNIFMFTVTMLQNFDFKLMPDQKTPSLDIVDGATPSVIPFEALVVLRQK